MQVGWYRQAAEGLEVTVRLTPKSSRDALEGVESGADGAAWLKARVRAVPEDGKANKALIVLVSKRTGIAKSRIRLLSGAASRVKVLLLECDDQEMREVVTSLAA